MKIKKCISLFIENPSASRPTRFHILYENQNDAGEKEIAE